MRAKQQENVARTKLSPEDLENCKRYNLTGNQLRAIRRTGLSLPHEARKRHQEKSVLESMEQEDDLFGLGDDASLDDLFSALRTDDRNQLRILFPCGHNSTAYATLGTYSEVSDKLGQLGPAWLTF